MGRRRTARRWADATGGISGEYVAVLLVIAALGAALAFLPRLVGSASEQAADCLFTDADCELDLEREGPGGDGGDGDPGGTDPGDDAWPGPRADGAPPLDREVTHGDGGPTRGEGDGPSGDDEVDLAYDAIQVWADYLWETHGRDSTDGNGAPLLADVQTQDPNTSNARWDRDLQMTFYRDGWLSPSVLYHEFAHGLVQAQTGGLNSRTSGDGVQTWALNEALADIYAMNVTRSGTVGEDLPDRADPIRTPSDPGAQSHPSHVDQYDESAGGHANSTIISHAYWQITQDIGWDAGEQIAYHAIENYVGQDVRFDDFRDAMLRAAEDLHGRDSDEYRGVEQGFADVGLDGTWTGP